MFVFDSEVFRRRKNEEDFGMQPTMLSDILTMEFEGKIQFEEKRKRSNASSQPVSQCKCCC